MIRLLLTLVCVICSLVLAIAQSQLCKTTTTKGYEFYFENVLENTPVGSVLGVVDVIGNASHVTLVQDDGGASDRFRFDNETREVKVITGLNSDRGSDIILSFIIHCQIIGSQDRSDIKIYLVMVDFNDNPPVFSKTHYNVTVSEDVLVDTVIYRDVNATDNDKEYDGNSRVSYRVADSTNKLHKEYFKIDVPSRSDIKLARALDFETLSVLVIEIWAVDSPAPGRGTPLTATATLTVYVTDADDLNPQFTANSYRGVIDEDAPIGTVVQVVPKLLAKDGDALNATIIYRLLDQYNLFAINETTAEVRTLRNLYVDVPSLTVVVLAIQADNAERQWFTMLTISVTASNLNAPRFSADIYNVTKSELEPVGNVIVATMATDTDFGTVIGYAIVESTDQFSIDQQGVIVLDTPLDYETWHRRTLHVTATDGSNTATATVIIDVVDVNDNNPLLFVDAVEIASERVNGKVVTSLRASDKDQADSLRFELRSYANLFAIRGIPQFSGSNLTWAEVYIRAEPVLLTRDKYSLLLCVIDSGQPPRESSVIIEVNFPPIVGPVTPLPGTTLGSTGSTRSTTEPVAAASVLVEKDNMLAIILGAVAGILLVIILILIAFIIWRNKRMREELNRARAPRGHSAKGLTYRQAETPDDLPKMDLSFQEETDDVSAYDGGTSVQENPLSDTGVNTGYYPSSGSSMDRDVGEINIETAIVPYDEDGYGYERKTPMYVNEEQQPYSGDDTVSNNSSHSDSTGGSRRGLVNSNPAEGGKLTSWDSDDNLHPQGAQKVNTKGSLASKKKERPEITVYF
ncbi:cadherin EGF LAG seven-pass G-type receptor 1-like isoform X2 [Dreissena polymorpha]|uniref:cadherin EGF LAG seven-pass G-type receptor 1-like isoform X2 n=1 Tax=Dreissena polymorpha TaxID=45954 RepID=UPI002263B8D3|nr:cadherin EGF LAG seven-pass G-type receptor 1-like isoform X2 [Dreissena polymorpha]